MKDYKYIISPTKCGQRIIAEIYYESNSLCGSKTHHLVTSQQFGKWYRGIKDQDYTDARMWVDNHLANISRANKSVEAKEVLYLMGSDNRLN